MEKSIPIFPIKYTFSPDLFLNTSKVNVKLCVLGLLTNTFKFCYMNFYGQGE